MQPGGSAERASIADVMRGLVADGAHLARAEIRLAKAEISANVSGLVTPVIMIAGALLLAVAALFTLMAAFVGWLTPLVGAGWAAFIVAGLAALLAAILIFVALAKVRAISLTPRRFEQSVTRDVAMLRDAV